MKRFRLSMWLSLGLVSLTMAIVLASYVLGFIPDGRVAELKSRAKVAESLAVQLAGAANRNDTVTLNETIKSVVSRNPDVLSAALRLKNGDLLVASEQHEQLWVTPEGEKSTPTHVLVPLLGPEGRQGTIEIVFAPPSAGTLIYGVPKSLLWFLAFILVSGFFAYSFFLKRTLRQLDPSRVIPERVQKSFDTLSEGVILLDEKERILLANHAFRSFYDGDLPTGTKINNLPWRMVDGSAQSGGYPWHSALRENKEEREELLSLRVANGLIHNFKVNATVITGARDKAIGAIVTLSDITNIKRKEDALVRATLDLEERERQISHQASKIAYLANHDTLSGCLNRRALMENLDWTLETAADTQGDAQGDAAHVSLAMLDIDGFGRISSTFGPVAADRLIAAMGALLREELGENHLVGRLGADRFCVLLKGVNPVSAKTVCEALQRSIGRKSAAFTPAQTPLSVCVGLTHYDDDKTFGHDLMRRAEQSLYAAKKFSANSFVEWTGAMAGTPVRATDANTSPQASLSGAGDHPHNPTAARDDSELGRFLTDVTSAMTMAKRTERPLAIVHLAIHGWDFLLEAWGEEACADILQAVRARITSGLRGDDASCCLNKDGGLLIELSELNDAEDAMWMAQRLVSTLHEPLEHAGKAIYVSAKVGVAMFPQDGADATMLLRNAGVAMRRARSEEALNAIKLYSPAMAQASAERLEIEAGIRLALQHNQFQLFFQPIIDAHTGQLSAAEALLRCDNEALKSVRIDKVIDVAEQTSLIASIDAWVVNRALEHMQEWCDQGLHLPKVSINISGKQLTNVAFMERVYERISAVRFSPSRVQIEVTETSKLADVETAAAQLKRLQHLGVQIALDDFGTGQASLTYLQRLHPDVVKIDRSFATGVNTNHANATLVSAMTVMSHCLGLKVVVEGVEDQEQLDFLRETRCDEIQGYFFSKPMPVVQMTQWLASYVLEHGAKAYAPDVANRPGPHGSHTVSAMQSHVPPHLAAPVNPSSDPRQPYSAASLPRQQSNGAAATMPDNTPLEPGMPAPTAAQNPAPNAINEPVRKSTAAA